MLHAARARPLLARHDLLHGFKQCGRNDRLKVSIKPFVAMLHKAEIRTMCQQSFDGNFGKWRAVARHHAQVRQKLRQRHERMRASGILRIRPLYDLRLGRVRLDIVCARIVHIPERGQIEPFTPAQFLAESSLDVLFEIIAVIFRLAERHLQHKEALRCRLKPKCRKTQRNDPRSVYRIDDAPTVDTIARQSVRMPRKDTDTLHTLDAHHHFAEHFATGTLCAFRLLKFLKNFKIFFTRDLSKFKKLRLNGHDLPIIVLGTLTRVEKIFWFDIHIAFGFETRAKSPHFSAPAPFQFAAAPFGFRSFYLR